MKIFLYILFIISILLTFQSKLYGDRVKSGHYQIVNSDISSDKTHLLTTDLFNHLTILNLQVNNREVYLDLNSLDSIPHDIFGIYGAKFSNNNDNFVCAFYDQNENKAYCAVGDVSKIKFIKQIPELALILKASDYSFSIAKLFYINEKVYFLINNKLLIYDAQNMSYIGSKNLVDNNSAILRGDFNKLNGQICIIDNNGNIKLYDENIDLIDSVNILSQININSFNVNRNDLFSSNNRVYFGDISNNSGDHLAFYDLVSKTVEITNIPVISDKYKILQDVNLCIQTDFGTSDNRNKIIAFNLLSDEKVSEKIIPLSIEANDYYSLGNELYLILESQPSYNPLGIYYNLNKNTIENYDIFIKSPLSYINGSMNGNVFISSEGKDHWFQSIKVDNLFTNSLLYLLPNSDKHTFVLNDGRVICTSQSESVMKIYDTKSNIVVKKIGFNNSSPLKSSDISSDSSKLILSFANGKNLIYSLENYSLLDSFNIDYPIELAKFTIDNDRIVFLTGSDYHNLKLMSCEIKALNVGEITDNTFRIDTSAYPAVGISQNKQFMLLEDASGKGYFKINLSDNSIKIIDYYSKYFSNHIGSSAISNDGRFIFLASFNSIKNVLLTIDTKKDSVVDFENIDGNGAMSVFFDNDNNKLYYTVSNIGLGVKDLSFLDDVTVEHLNEKGNSLIKIISTNVDNNELTIKLSSHLNKYTGLKIYNLLGELITSQNEIIREGINEIHLSLPYRISPPLFLSINDEYFKMVGVN